MASAPAITALIIDDEPLARQELQFLLDSEGGISVLGHGSNGIEAVNLIRTLQPDVVFLDVRMPGLDGFAVLRKLLSSHRAFPLPAVVFATAFDQYAVKAFEVNAVDYLLKPFDRKRLRQTLEKLRSRLRPSSGEIVPSAMEPARRGEDPRAAPAVEERVPDAWLQTALQAAPLTQQAELPTQQATPLMKQAPTEAAGNRSRLWEVAQAKLDALLRMVEEQAAGLPSAGETSPARTGRVVVRTGSRLLLVDEKDVCFAYVNEGRIAVVTKTFEGDSNVRTLEELADQLDASQFWRAHRSHLVNLQHIREVVPWFKSTYQLRMDDQKGTEVPVSRAQTKRLRELFNL